MKKNILKVLYSVFLDALFLAIICAFGTYLISFYFNAQFINTGTPDWIATAFRTKMLSVYGFVSWTHVWSNGINIWQAYPLVPNIVTLLFSKLFSLSISRSMVLLSIGIFILLRVEIYLLLRFEKLSHMTAFMSSLLSFPIALYWAGVNEYNLQFAFILFPFVLYLWKLYLHGKVAVIFPFIAGLSFLIHPIFAVYVLFLWIIGLFVSEKKVISFTVLFEILIFLIGSSFFWYPLILKDSYTYTDPALASLDYTKNLLNKSSWFGLGLTLIIAVLFLTIRLFMPVKKDWEWMKILSIVVLLLLLLTILASSFQLPFFLSIVPFIKGVPFIGIAICFAIAPVIEAVLQSKITVLKFLLLFGFVFGLTEGIWITSIYSSPAESSLNDSVQSYIRLGHKEVGFSKIWSSTIDVTSFLSPLSVRLPYSYYPQLDSNQISPRIGQLVLNASYPQAAPLSAMDRINDYFKLSGVSFVFFDELSPFTKVLEDNPHFFNYKDFGLVKLSTSVTHIFQVPWKPREVELISQKYEATMNHFPFTSSFARNNDYVALDQSVHDFAQLVYAKENKPLSIQYPTQESMSVAIPPFRNSDKVYINESFSNNWHAMFQGRSQKIIPVGPNFMEVELDNFDSGGTLFIQHSWPSILKYLVLLTIATPALIVLVHITRLTSLLILETYETRKNR